MKHKSGCQDYQGEMACENDCPIVSREIVLRAYPRAVAVARPDGWDVSEFAESGQFVACLAAAQHSEEAAWVDAANQINPGYSDRLDAEDQVDAEEAIAALLFDRFDTLDEDDCANLGRDILKLVLHKFRPDLFEIAPTTRRKEE